MAQAGATQQIHRVTTPGGARTQLTFYAEPVSRALAIPGTMRFVLTRDTGGDEWFQLYLAQISGEPVPFTEPGTRNLSPTVSRDGKLLAWSRAQRGSSEYTLFVADPADPRGARAVHREQSETLPAGDAAPRKRPGWMRWYWLGLAVLVGFALVYYQRTGLLAQLSTPRGLAEHRDVVAPLAELRAELEGMPGELQRSEARAAALLGVEVPTGRREGDGDGGVAFDVVAEDQRHPGRTGRLICQQRLHLALRHPDLPLNPLRVQRGIGVARLESDQESLASGVNLGER